MKVNQGGLMRCCLQSLGLYVEAHPEGVLEGTEIGCLYHTDPEKPEMVLDGNIWRWKRE